jgi:steroid delta-isomerase
VTSEARVRAAVRGHFEAVAAADADALAGLYADGAVLEDPAGGQRREGRSAVREHFAAALRAPRRVEPLWLAVVGREVALLFRATDAGGEATEVFDVMSFDEEALITSLRTYWPAESGASEA